MKVICVILLSLTILSNGASAQEVEDVIMEMNEMEKSDTLPTQYKLKLQRYLYLKPYILEGDTMRQYLLPELPVYAEIKFRSEKQRIKYQKKYDRMVYNVKKVLPLAQQVNALIRETYETLEKMPDKKSKSAHIKAVEKEIKKTYTPIMKKLTFSQGKLLIKLIDRECNQTSYEIVKAFLGPGKAAFYQVFAWTFGASLKKEYDADNDDAMIEKIVVQVEMGLL